MADLLYYCLLTDAGTELEAAALAAEKPVKLTKISVGDGGGDVPTPDKSAVALVREVYRKDIDSKSPDAEDKKVTWLHMLIPATEGEFWIREFGVWAEPLDGEGDPVLYAYGNHAPYYKSKAALGQAITHEISVPIITSSTAEIQVIVSAEGYATRVELFDDDGFGLHLQGAIIPYGEGVPEANREEGSAGTLDTVARFDHVHPAPETAKKADEATHAESATSADYAASAGSALSATSAETAGHATSADSATTAETASKLAMKRTITLAGDAAGSGTFDGSEDLQITTTVPTMGAASASAGGAKGLVPASNAGDQLKFLRADGTWIVPTNTTYVAFKGASTSAAGVIGLVPAPTAGKQTYFLQGNGTWVQPTGATVVTSTDYATTFKNALK